MRPVRSGPSFAERPERAFVFAQSYPSGPVKVIVAFTAGSATDILARVMADQFSKSMGQPFVVENRPGAGGIVGTQQAKNAAPDGYTLIMAGSGPFGINPGVYSHLPYDPVQDFALIGNIGLTPQCIVVGAPTPYKTLKDLVAAAKAKPGEITFASLGNGSTSHLTMEAFQSAAGVKMNHIPFKGSGPEVVVKQTLAKLKKTVVKKNTRAPGYKDDPYQ